MNIETVKNTIDNVENKIANVKAMIEDYNVCKSETSKKVLEAAIIKIAKPLENIASSQTDSAAHN